jgi:hypothetical protein
MSKAKKICDINISIFEDAKCVVKSTIIHKIEGIGTIKEIVPKSELDEFISVVVPSVKINSVLSDIDKDSPIPVVVY